MKDGADERMPSRCAYCGRCAGHWSGRPQESHEPCCEPWPGSPDHGFLQWRDTVREWEARRDARFRSVLWVLGLGLLLTPLMGTPIWFALGLLYALFCSLVDRGPNLTDDRREAQDEDWMWDELLEARERDEARVREVADLERQIKALETRIAARDAAEERKRGAR